MQPIRRIFRDESTGRLRALWRLLTHLLLITVLGFATGFVLLGGLELAANGLARTVHLLTSRTVEVLIGLLAVTGATYVAGRWLDKRPFYDFGFHLDRSWWVDLGFGLALGGLLMVGIFLTELALGWVTVTETFRAEPGLPFGRAILFPLAAFLMVGFYEELLSRGYQLKNLAEGLNFPWLGPRNAVLAAWLLTSLVFGALHAGNPNATWISTVNISVAGLFLGLGMLLTGELAIPIGVHITWNFFQGNVFGFPVSGTRLSQATVFAIQQQGPELWTGGAFGPEAGLIGLVAIGVGSGLTLLWVRWRRGRVGVAGKLAEWKARSSDQ